MAAALKILYAIVITIGNRYLYVYYYRYLLVDYTYIGTYL